MKTGSAVQMIEDWETALSDVEVPGSKGIARDLASLRRQLESETPDEGRVLALLNRLGEATVRISERTDMSTDKLKMLGEALRDSGAPTEEEAEDVEAAAAPVRRRKAA